jgi:hypothetical protein
MRSNFPSTQNARSCQLWPILQSFASNAALLLVLPGRAPDYANFFIEKGEILA